MNYDNTRPVHYRSTVVIKANSPIKRLLPIETSFYPAWCRSRAGTRQPRSVETSG